MNEIVAVTIGVGEKHRAMAELAAESYRIHGGGRVEILDRRHLEASGLLVPGHLKFKIFDFVPDAKRILYFDADMVFLRPFPFKELAEEDALYCVPDGEEKPWVRRDSKRIGVPANEYFNSGFFVASREHHLQMLKLSENLSPISVGMFNDQTQLNWARELLGIKTRYLPQYFNNIEFFKKDVSNTIVGHFIGYNLNALSIGELECLYRYWMNGASSNRS